MHLKFLSIMLIAAPLALTSCSEEVVKVDRASGFDTFVESYNGYILDWLQKELKAVEEQEVVLQEELAKAATEQEKEAVRKTIESLNTQRIKFEYRLGLKDYIAFKTDADVPEGLLWENGLDNPEIGDPKAKKGGAFHAFIPDFPPTLCPIGPNANSSFRSKLYDEIELSLVGLHPLTQKFTPSLAKEWAIGPDKQTVFFRLDPKATYSDGVKVQAIDYVFYFYIRLSDNITAPYPKQYFREEIANITIYGPDLISISLPQPKPLLPYYASVSPAPSHFYDEYGPDYAERYQWRIPPTTGAYTVLPGGLKKGRSIELSRVKDWWAKDNKFTKNAFNADKIIYHVIADTPKAFELFRIGELDTFYLGDPDLWYEKMEIDEYFNGYIEKAQFYNVFPRIPRGMYLNISKAPLDNIDVRKGFAHALNFKKINTVLFRGDADRLKHFSEGFGQFSSTSIEPYEFSVSKAQAYFKKAGYSESDSEGYLKKPDGKRLQIELSWGQHPLNDKMMALLKEEAKKAGLEILLDSAQSTVNFRKVLEKRHQVSYMGWGVGPPFPRYYGSFHSSNAYDKKGNVKQGTNNINVYANPEMDTLVETVRGAKSIDEIEKAAKRAQEIIHEEVLFVPALKTAYIRMAYWNWIVWPQTKYYEFCTPNDYVPTESYLYWIDEDAKARTLKAQRNGESFPEQNHLYELYRNGIPSLDELEKRTPTTH